ncbi:uncharacterized protein PHACADRAFT_167829 [Phanerochaete carnosa HHB-10118-sp]|uniref:Beta-lactamase-related domain-containing protein n=1 Tax=Phanerochaete carnosa (strain HHB-10118-sp) TaxID=650164 RepID=K5WMQ5_PHACS|nr:uncharacterized protein PHACADRAFT_167829 [Phanerochaete carnosa HHB-10118-sp]EKM60484.1 hypothetical protein PHACADRAFT_167829 [Phanerochaete carnosa HHB-10118-sp]
MLSKAVCLALLASNALCQQRALNQWPVVANPEKQVITSELSEFVEKIMKDGNVPGLTLGVVHSNGTVELGAFGRKTEDGDEMTVDTLYNIASCSKAFLASSMGIPIDDFVQGRNQTPLPPGLTDLFPGDWELMDKWASEKATLRDALSHQTGLHDFSYHPTDKPVDVTRRTRRLRPTFELRQRYHYNNQHYIIGAHIISTYSGMPYTEIVKERIWKRLSMTSSTFSPNEAALSSKLAQTWTANRRRILFWFSEEVAELSAGPAGIITNVVDMTRWLQTLLNADVDSVTNETIIPRETYDANTRTQSIVSTRLCPRMGWDTKSYQGHNLWIHGGEILGIHSEVLFMLDSGLGIVTLANGDGKNPQELATMYRIVEDFLGLDRKEFERILVTIAASRARSEDGSAQVADDVKYPSPLSLPLEEYASKYYDPGYGNITLCAPTPHPSDECADVLESWSFFENTTEATQQVLYAAISSLWISHLRLAHTDGDTFGVSGTYLFTNGYGKDKSPFTAEETGEPAASAEFWIIHAEGSSLVRDVALNGFAGEMTERQRIRGTVEETAEIWLTKV